MPLITDPVDLELDANNQVVIPMRHVSGTRGVAQRIRIAILTVRGDWFRDLDRGIPLVPAPGVDPSIVILGNKAFDRDLAEAQFRDAISRVPGVGTIDALSVVLNNATRKLTVTWRVTCVFDDVSVDTTSTGTAEVPI